MKQSRQERPHAFRRPGNAAQYTFMEEVIEHVREASWQGWHLEKVGGLKAEAALKDRAQGSGGFTYAQNAADQDLTSVHLYHTVGYYTID